MGSLAKDIASSVPFMLNRQVKYPNLLDLWSRYANAEVGASNSQLKSGTVLFVFEVSRFIRRCLNQRSDPRPGNPT
ncbi:hypothetical protein [Moorena sp. SIO3I6]|uniref:hypothetical protein n=1 Tax=Moorena sp. SIO3I6 TaxID=2607831 RepID=UPI0025F064A0|nr:hypothetical protein [Moorena sp. SIO3I6]